MKAIILLLSLVLSATVTGPLLAQAPQAPPNDYRFAPVPFTAMRLTGGFWAPRVETNRAVTVRYDFKKCKETGRIDNFAKAAGLVEGDFQGYEFDDSDVFKVIEGAAYTLAMHPDPDLDRYLDELIAKIVAAQEPDGYLYSFRTIHPESAEGRMAGPERWSNLRSSHELYNVGHLYEAAVAHFQATGKRTLLDAAIKSADLIDRTFGSERRRDPPGHEEIEIGLVKLYRTTGEERYLRLAKFFIEERGRADGHELYGEYAQDHKPLAQQEEAVGHAVRAGYLYAGAADVAALTGDAAYRAALVRLWDDVASRKLALTGGIGARSGGEAFGEPYELPNREAYNETCAAIANALWNHRMFLLEGDAKYIDVLERIIYNGFLAGVSLGGDRFFYPNPLASDGATPFNHGAVQRQEWFGVSCCPVNVVRFIPSIAGFVYAAGERDVYVNLFAQGEADIRVGEQSVKISQRTEYPWEGKVRITVDPQAPAVLALHVRIPGWALGRPVPSDLYRDLAPLEKRPDLRVNGEAVAIAPEKGYAVIEREWSAGDVIELDLPMNVRRVVAHENVEADRGRVALELRGPIVYCIEAADHEGQVSDLALPDDVELSWEHVPDLLGGVTVVRGGGQRRIRQMDGSENVSRVGLTAIPYYAWAHRDVGEMAVWLPRSVELASLPPSPTLASKAEPSASHVWESDTVRALNDQIEPESSIDHGLPRFTWWPRLGSEEWVAYRFDEPQEVSAVEVYWFDDTGRGRCRTPKSWRVEYREGDEWRPVQNAGEYGTAKDQYEVVKFEPVSASELRLVVQLQDESSAGILEWRLK